MKVLILGHSRHGKDELAMVMRQLFGITYCSSSWAAASKAVFPVLAPLYGYETVEQCFNDRHNHRGEWHRAISEYNTPNKAKLCLEIMAHHDCYVGMRCPLELEAVKPLFDYILWVDRSRHQPPEGADSMKIAYDPDCMIWVNNNGQQVGDLWRTVGLNAPDWFGDNLPSKPEAPPS